MQDAGKVGALIVKARSAQGIGLYLVEVDAAGVTIVQDAILDLTRCIQAHVALREVEAQVVLAAPGDGARAWAAAEPAILTIVAADMVGAGEWQLQTTAEYARTRVQFERPIGFFQAVKHPLVDMMVQLDAARSLVYDAACAFDHEPESAECAPHGQGGRPATRRRYCWIRSVQLHGGIGFTWGVFRPPVPFKRQRHNEVLYGDAAHQRAVLADRLLGKIGATT